MRIQEGEICLYLEWSIEKLPLDCLKQYIAGKKIIFREANSFALFSGLPIHIPYTAELERRFTFKPSCREMAFLKEQLIN